jgi:hypothetical protein
VVDDDDDGGVAGEDDEVEERVEELFGYFGDDDDDDDVDEEELAICKISRLRKRSTDSSTSVIVRPSWDAISAFDDDDARVVCCHTRRSVSISYFKWRRTHEYE